MTPNVDGSTVGTRLPPTAAWGAGGWSRRELCRGEALYRAGDSAGNVYRVEEGLLSLTIMAPGGKERIVALAGPGDVIGALGPSGGGFQETAQSLSEQAVALSRPQACLLAESAYDLLTAAALRASRLQQALEDAELPVTIRLARILLRLGHRFGQRAEDGSVRLTLPLTHEHLAAMVGAARETTSSALGEIRNSGLLSGTRGRYRFRPDDLERLPLLLAAPATVPVAIPDAVPDAAFVE